MPTQKLLGTALLTLTIGLAFVLSGCSEKEITLKFADCPMAVQKTIVEHAGGVQFPTVDRETKSDGRVVYEAKGKRADGKKIEIKVATDGALVEMKTKDD